MAGDTGAMQNDHQTTGHPAPLRLSIAMATYNGARFLQAQLDSFTAQTRRPDELVVCDDGSSDATMDILHAYAASAPFEVRVVRNEVNLGYKRNFEKALSLCTGDIVFLSDQDDVWLPAKLERVEAEFRADPLIMEISNDMIITDASLNHGNVTQLGNVRASGAGDKRFAFGCAMALRKEMLALLFPFPVEDFSHDGWIADACGSIGVRRILDEPLQLYRRHDSNGSNSFLSDTNKVTTRTMVAQLDLSSPLSGWDPHFKMIAVKRNWVTQRRAELEKLGLTDRVEPLLHELQSEETDIRARLALLRTPRLRRAPGVIAFWASGRYRRFTGWKSALKDLIRP